MSHGDALLVSQIPDPAPNVISGELPEVSADVSVPEIDTPVPDISGDVSVPNVSGLVSMPKVSGDVSVPDVSAVDVSSGPGVSAVDVSAPVASGDASVPETRDPLPGCSVRGLDASLPDASGESSRPGAICSFPPDAPPTSVEMKKPKKGLFGGLSFKKPKTSTPVSFTCLVGRNTYCTHRHKCCVLLVQLQLLRVFPEASLHVTHSSSARRCIEAPVAVPTCPGWTHTTHKAGIIFRLLRTEVS